MGALWRTHFRRTGGRDPAFALRAMLGQAANLAREHGGRIKTNVILAGPSEVIAARFAEPGEPNSLFTLTGQPRWSGGSVVASEPLDDGPGWQEVDPSVLVRADSRGIRHERLELAA